MKKIYTTPAAKVIELCGESLIATSLTGNGEGIEYGGEGSGMEADSHRREGFFGGGMWDNM